jgi:hypothetical protein
MIAIQVFLVCAVPLTIKGAEGFESKSLSASRFIATSKFAQFSLHISAQSV